MWRVNSKEFGIGWTVQGEPEYVLDKNKLRKEEDCKSEECECKDLNTKILYKVHLLCKRLLKDMINILSFGDE